MMTPRMCVIPTAVLFSVAGFVPAGSERQLIDLSGYDIDLTAEIDGLGKLNHITAKALDTADFTARDTVSTSKASQIDAAAAVAPINKASIRFRPFDNGPDATQLLPSAVPHTTALKDYRATFALDSADFTGGTCTSSADDTCSLQALFDAACSGTNREALLSRNAYIVSAALVLGPTCDGVSIRSQSAVTSLTSTASSADILRISAANVRASGLLFNYTGAPTVGTAAVRWTGVNGRMTGFHVAKAYTAFKAQGATALFLRDFQLTNFVGAGLHIQNVYDLHASGFIINAGHMENGTLGGLRLEDTVEAAVVADGDVLNGQYSLYLTSTTNSPNLRPAYNQFAHLYLDNAALGSYVSNTDASVFDAVWWSGGRSGTGYPGLTVSSSTDLSFVANQWMNSGSHGLDVEGTVKGLSIQGGIARGNSATSGIGAASGINIRAGTTDFIIMGLRGRNPSPADYGQQAYAVSIAAGASDRYVIQGNIVSGNVLGGVLDNGTGHDKLVQGNF